MQIDELLAEALSLPRPERARIAEELLSSIWGGEFEIESNVVDRHIRELRVKLGDDWRTPMFIETVPGRGYRFRSQVAVSDAAN